MKKFKIGEAIVFEPKWAKNKKIDCRYPLKYGEIVYFLSNIPNVIGHCIVIKYKGMAVPMVHPEDFRKAKDEEL